MTSCCCVAAVLAVRRYLGGYNDYPATPRATKSALWLSVLTADLPLQLTFVLEGTSWSDPTGTGGVDGGWLQTAAVAAWAAEARQLASSFFPSFEATATTFTATSNSSSNTSSGNNSPVSPSIASSRGVTDHDNKGAEAPMVVVEKAALLRGPPAVAPDPTPVRARAWRETCGAGYAANSSGLCLHLIVVNLAQDSPASFSLRLSPAAITGSGAAFPLVASRLFDSGGYDVKTTADGLLSDFVDAGDTVIYEVGCNGARYSTGSAEAAGTGTGIGALPTLKLEAMSCSNRRVACVHGFLKTDPHHARCAPRTGPT
jgi:hypothetical protein